MKVEAVHLSNFRSVSSCELLSCGGFNVLIGKNNSGKSNVLSAIDLFFKAVNRGDIVCLDPLVSKEIDFYNKNLESPAEVTLTFLLNESERSELIADIIQDAPQMTNAVDRLNPHLWLSVRICFNLLPNNYACVNKISLLEQDGFSESGPDSEKIILNVDGDAALKLY